MIFSKSVGLIACLLLLISGTLSSLVYAESETYVPSKITIGTYNKLTAKLGSENMPWTFVKMSHVAVDDNHYIYVLDRQGKRILSFSANGNLIKEIKLSGVDFSDKSEELGDEGYIEYQIEVSSDGKFLYITEGGKENNWAVLDSGGKPIKKNISLKQLARVCNGKLRANSDELEVDQNLNIIRKVNINKRKHQARVIDSQDNVYYLNLDNNASKKVVITKTNINGNPVFTKEIANYSMPISFIGIDDHDNIYIAAGSPRSILKVSKEGIVQAEIPFPNTPFFKGWTKCKVLCDGTIYCVPDYSALWNSNKDKLINGEYSIYFFKKK